MKRFLASSLGMTLGLVAAAGRADDLVWRAARDRTPPPPAPAAPAPPPLVTTSPPGTAGILPGATVLLGGHDLSDTFRQGARFGTVWWMDDCASWGFDSRYFFTGTKRESFAVNSNQFPNLFRPFFAA